MTRERLTRQCAALLNLFVGGGMLLATGASFGQMADSVDLRTIKGLQERRLFDLARLHAESVLENPSLDPRERVSISVALVESLTRQAAATGGESRDEAWNLAERTGVQFREQMRDQPRGILLEMQAVLVHQARIEQLVREIDVAVGGAEARDMAQQLARQVQRDFEAVQTHTGELANRPEAGRPPGSLSQAELLTLRSHAAYQSARALMLGGMLYPPNDQAARVDVMERVESRMREVLQSTSPDQPFWWTVQADRLAAARAVGNRERISEIAGSLPTSQPDATSRDRVQAELILAMIEQDRFDEALRVAGEEAVASDVPELDLARVRLFAALSARDAARQEVWQQRALDMTNQIELVHGPWWGRRAEMVVVGTVGNASSSGNLDLLVRIADEARRKEQWSEALEALNAAFAQALVESNREIAWQTGFAAAVIEQERENFDDAARRFDELARQLKDHPDAHAAHLMACWSFSRTLEKDRQRFDEYTSMLEFNVHNWPASSSADQSRIWLASIRRAHREFADAVTLLMNVNPASPLKGAALEQVRELLPQWTTAAGRDAPDLRETLEAIAAQTRSIEPADVGDDPVANRREAQWQSAALQSELQLLYGVADDDDGPATLDRLSAEADDASRADYGRALQLVASAWANVTLEEQQKFLGQLDPSRSVLTAMRLGLAGTFRPDPVPANCHEFLIAIADRFERQIDGLDEREQYQWGVAQLRAFMALQPPNAVETSSLIASQYPRDATVQRLFGEMLLARSVSDDSILPATLAQWRKLAATTPPHTNDWYDAKLNVARLLVASSKQDEARKLLQYLKAVPPGWTNSKRTGEFEKLLEELEK